MTAPRIFCLFGLLPCAVGVAAACANGSGVPEEPTMPVPTATGTATATATSNPTGTATTPGTGTTGTCAGGCDDKNACTMDTCESNAQCKHVALAIDDVNACTADACDPAAGVSHTAITACSKVSDGCCPSGCTNATDSDCGTCNNLALTAVAATDSPAAANDPAVGAINLNDGIVTKDCSKYAWTEAARGPTAAFTYTWPSEITVGSIAIVTNGAAPCTSINYALQGGTIEWWDGAAWQMSTTFTGKSGTYAVNLVAPVRTSKLRINRVQIAANGVNPFIYEWQVFAQTNCMFTP